MAGWIETLARDGGYFGIALLMLIETVFPPIPSEVVMPLVGTLAADGQLSLPGGIAAGAAGSLAGAYAWYLLARRIGSERLKGWASRHGRWITMSPEDVDGACRWLREHGTWAVLVGRMVPAIRSLISIPAGVAAMETTTFLVFSAIGTVMWCSALAALGFVLRDQTQIISRYIGVIANVIVGGALAIYVYRVVTFKAR
ncbi:MAG TPA: DedA family protein [Vicinamibacterales bacterium]